MKLSPHECLVYGEGAEEVWQLRQRSSYSVSINAYKDGEYMRYVTPFRLYETEEDGTEICRLKWSNETNDYDLEACDNDDY